MRDTIILFRLEKIRSKFIKIIEEKLNFVATVY